MIGKIKQGKGFRGVLDYALNPEKGHLIGGNMDGTEPRQLAKEFGISRELNTNLAKPVFHASLALSPGERLADEQWNQVAERYMKEMGFEDSQYAVARHTDKDHDHIHVIASRITLEGKTVSDSMERIKSQEVIRGIERDYNLERVPSSHEIDRRAPTRGELQYEKETGQKSIKRQLQGKIDKALKQSRTVNAFVKNMEAQGVSLTPNMGATGKATGISYQYAGEMMKGSDLGRGYTINGLQKRGLSYDVERDNKELVKAKERAERGDVEREYNNKQAWEKARQELADKTGVPHRYMKPGEGFKGRVEGVSNLAGHDFARINTGKEVVLTPIQALDKTAAELKKLAGKEVKAKCGNGPKVYLEEERKRGQELDF